MQWQASYATLAQVKANLWGASEAQCRMSSCFVQSHLWETTSEESEYSSPCEESQSPSPPEGVLLSSGSLSISPRNHGRPTVVYDQTHDEPTSVLDQVQEPESALEQQKPLHSKRSKAEVMRDNQKYAPSIVVHALRRQGYETTQGSLQGRRDKTDCKEKGESTALTLNGRGFCDLQPVFTEKLFEDVACHFIASKKAIIDMVEGATDLICLNVVDGASCKAAVKDEYGSQVTQVVSINQTVQTVWINKESGYYGFAVPTPPVSQAQGRCDSILEVLILRVCPTIFF